MQLVQSLVSKLGSIFTFLTQKISIYKIYYLKYIPFSFSRSHFGIVGDEKGSKNWFGKQITLQIMERAGGFSFSDLSHTELHSPRRKCLKLVCSYAMYLIWIWVFSYFILGIFIAILLLTQGLNSTHMNRHVNSEGEFFQCTIPRPRVTGNHNC